MDDCCVYYVRFPNRAARAAVLPNDDGSYSIYVNLLFPEEVQRAALAHELRHIRLSHLYAERPVAMQETEARGERAPALKSICCYTADGIEERLVPQTSGADFALRVSDHAMRPHYRLGTLLDCRARKPAYDGDAAVYLIGGRATLRQVFLDVRGTLHLICTNRACAALDLHLEPPYEGLPKLLGVPKRRRALPLPPG